MSVERRAFLATLGGGLLGAGLSAQSGGRGNTPVSVLKAKTTTLFKSPEGYPNAVTATQDGLWIGEQKSDNACLVDWNGKPLKTVKTESKNTSGMAIGGGFIWMGANAAPNDRSWAWVFGSPSAALMALLSVSTMSRGVSRGAAMPDQPLAS